MLASAYDLSDKFWTEITEDEVITKWQYLGRFTYLFNPQSVETRIISVFRSKNRIGINPNGNHPLYFLNTVTNLVLVRAVVGEKRLIQIQKGKQEICFAEGPDGKFDALEQHLRKYCISLDFDERFKIVSCISHTDANQVAYLHYFVKR